MQCPSVHWMHILPKQYVIPPYVALQRHALSICALDAHDCIVSKQYVIPPYGALQRHALSICALDAHDC